MAQFKFKLEVVLRHRRAVEQEKLRLLSEAMARAKEVEDQIAALNESLRTTNDDLRSNRLVGRVDVNFLAAHRRYLLGMQKRGGELVRALAERQKEVEAARAAVAEAARQTKILEKLRENLEQRWREAANQKELAMLDEAGMQMAVEK